MYGFNILMLKIENIHLDYNLYYWIIKMLHQTRIYILYNGNFDGEHNKEMGVSEEVCM